MARKFLTPIDLTVNELRNAVIQNLATAPGSPIGGLCYFDTVLGQFGVYSGSTWLYLTPTAGTAAGGDLTGTYPNPTLVGTSNVESIIRANRLDQMTAPTAAVSMGSQNLTSLANPVNPQDAATKTYVDAAVEGLSVKPSAVCGTTAALPANTYSAGVLTATTNGAFAAVDGVTLATVGQPILVMNEAAPANNGLYTLTVVGTGSVPYQLTRSVDMNTAAEVPGAFVFVESGTVNAGNGFVVAGAGPWTLGTTAITWTQFSGAGEITVTTPIQKTGNALSLTTVPVALGGTAGTSASAARTNLSGTTNPLPQKYSVLVGTGSSTSITVTHGLGTQDVITAVYDAAAFNVVECDVVNATSNTVTLGFTVAPASNAYKCVVIG